MIFLDELKELQDNKYRDFQAKLIPNLDKKNILGIRIPKLRTLSKKIRNKSDFNILYSELNILAKVYKINRLIPVALA